MSADDFAKIYNNVTTTTNLYTYGRVNINTAGVDVLTALFMGATNIGQDTATAAAQALVAYRQQNPSTLNSIAWISPALDQNYSSIITALAAHDWITTRSFQFTADIAALGPFGRGWTDAVKFIFDISDGTPKIIYRQDLSRLGWALREKGPRNVGRTITRNEQHFENQFSQKNCKRLNNFALTDFGRQQSRRRRAAPHEWLAAIVAIVFRHAHA